MTAFPPSMLASMKSFLFCGDVGDPIYATEFLEIIAYLKRNEILVKIVTNGSYKSVDWWDRLGHMLTNADSVTFSVDGWDQASNELYRVNSNFDSIVTGIKSLRAASECKIIWSYIVFNFNEHHSIKIKDLAKSLGVDEFVEVHSTKFDGRYAVNGVDPLRPEVVIGESSYHKKRDKLSDRRLTIEIVKQKAAHSWAKCLNWKKEMFINVDGLVFPCPWFNSGYQQNDFVEKYRDRLSIKTRPLSDILADPLWEEFLTRLELFPLEVCSIKCKNDQ